MSERPRLERCLARHAGKLMLILIAIATVLRALQIWRAGGWL